jgi:hypothetical protein
VYNQKVIFNELECKQILSQFVVNRYVAHKIRYDGVVYEKGCSTTSDNLKFDLNNQWIFDKIKNWTDESNLGLVWKKKPPGATFRKYKKGDFFLKHTDLNYKNYTRNKRGLLILTIGIQLSGELDYSGGEFFVWDNNDKIYIGVHIAQPICWLTKEDILERSKKAFSTLYLNDTNKNLWSDELTENASLLQGKEKPTYSVIFEISNSKIINIESFPSTIINKLTTDYDSINFKNIIEVKEITEKILEFR